MSTPTPPLGYSLDDVPNFLKPTAANMRVEVGQPNGVDIARVSSTMPNVVQVHQADQFGQPQLNHEVTHGFDLSRNPAVVNQMQNDLASGKLPKAYDYGGIDGLLAAQDAGKTIANFGPEQRAQMVKDYALEIKAAMKSGDLARFDKANRAYGPLIAQEAAMPGKNDPMNSINTTPAAPGLPPSAETGIMEENPLMGNQMRVVPPAGYTLDR